MIEIPGYRIVRTLGQGGMATVYLAIQESFEREVALKILSDDLAKDPTFSERFLREAKIVSRLVHPNIVTVYDVGIESEHHFLSMEYIPGADLKNMRGQLSLSERLNTVMDIARALNFAGQKGYVHRDVKPENIMLHADSGRAVLMDFGIARPLETASSMTQTGTAIGTPHYMSPEQARGQVVDSRSDLYSLGVVLFLMLAGHVPFDADSAVAVGVQHVSEPIPRLPVYLHVFQSIINKVLSKDPGHRYQTGDELIADLDALPPYALAEIVAWESAHEHGEEVIDGDIDTDAETLVGQEVISAAIQPPLAVETPVVGEDRVVYHEEESGSLWPWVAAVMLASGVALAVYYQQQLPADYRLPVSSDERDGIKSQSAERIEGPRPQVLGTQKGDSDPEWPINMAGNASITALAAGVAVPADIKYTVAESSVNGGWVADGVMAKTDDAELKPEAPVTMAKSSLVASAHLQGGDFDRPDEVSLHVPSNRDNRLAEAADWVAQGLADPQLAPTLMPRAANHYRQLLGRNPADPQARQGLRTIRENIQQQARSALESQRFSEVERLLALAGTTFPKAANEPKFQRLQKRMQTAMDVKTLLEQAGERVQANALTTPLGDNAAERFKQVLALKPGHPQATEGLERIAQRYAALATRQLAAGNLEKAKGYVSRGLGVVADNAALTAIAKRLEQRQSLDVALRQAQRLRKEGKALTPAGSSALDAYRKILANQPRQPQALLALEEIEDDLVARIESFISNNDYQQATAEISRALFFFPTSQTLQGLKHINERAIADMFAASQPQIPQVLVSNRVMASLVDTQQRTLVVDRIIHVGFSFENFEAATSVVQAVLFDGARRLQIAQVPVIVSGQAGVQFFRIERPVEGFADGGYSIDLMLEGQRLSSAAFEVGSHSEL